MLFSEPNGKVTKFLEPGQTEFFFHAEAAPGAEEIAKSTKISSREVY